MKKLYTQNMYFMCDGTIVESVLSLPIWSQMQACIVPAHLVPKFANCGQRI